MDALTGNQCTLKAKALTHAGGFRETGVLPSRCADYQPARSRRGFFYWRGRNSRKPATQAVLRATLHLDIAECISVRLTDRPAHVALESATTENGFQQYDMATSPRYGHPTEDGSWKCRH